MEEINFINSKNSNQNHILKKYIKLAITLSVVTIIILIVITVKQKNKLNVIKENIKKSEIKLIANAPKATCEPIDQKTQLKNEKLELKKQILEINNLKKTPKKETSILLNIYKNTSKQINLHDITITKSDFTISAECVDDKIANKITKRLSRLQHIKTAQLTSIQKNNNKFAFHIKGGIKA